MNDNEEEKLKIFQSKANFYFKNKISVHVETNNERFYNGFISEISSDFFMIKEEKLGLMPIFFKEIRFIEKNIDKYQQPNY